MGTDIAAMTPSAVTVPARSTLGSNVTALYALAAIPDYIASADRHGTVIVWEADTGKVAQKFEVPTLYTYDPRQRKRSIGGIRALAFSWDGRSADGLPQAAGFYTIVVRSEAETSTRKAVLIK